VDRTRSALAGILPVSGGGRHRRWVTVYRGWTVWSWPSTVYVTAASASSATAKTISSDLGLAKSWTA
jgi:hypothetical protein